jgi:hypothetical protein
VEDQDADRTDLPFPVRVWLKPDSFPASVA